MLFSKLVYTSILRFSIFIDTLVDIPNLTIVLASTMARLTVLGHVLLSSWRKGVVRGMEVAVGWGTHCSTVCKARIPCPEQGTIRFKITRLRNSGLEAQSGADRIREEHFQVCLYLEHTQLVWL